MAFFSVVVPLYNKEQHIARCIKSIMDQTFPDFELIVVNDGSTDGSMDIVAGFEDERLQCIHTENQGVSAARNRGIAEATSKYIALLDADDYWLPQHLESCHEIINAWPQQVDIYCSGYQVILSRRKTIKAHLSSPVSEAMVLHPFFKYSYQWFPIHTSLFEV